jgi:ATP-binding protein involved in chromosome partitioning
MKLKINSVYGNSGTDNKLNEIIKLLEKIVTKEEVVLKALSTVMDPDLNKDIVSLGFIKDLKCEETQISFSIELTTPACPVKDLMKKQAYEAVVSCTGIKDVEIKMTSKVRAFGERNEKLLPDVKNIIPVASGKGGVGKSTISANLAISLANTGAKVGLLDADIYGPSIPKILNLNQQPMVSQNTIFPVIKHGIKIMSMGFFLQEDQAVIWRGPMLGKMIDQFLTDVEWGELDYLIIDLPPGTGDIQLSLCQAIPLTGALIVTTPQDVAINVARKAILMFNKLKTPVIGVVENMSYYECKHCGEKERIFGEGGGEKTSKEFDLPFLGEIPLTSPIRKASDSGNPVALTDPESSEAKAFNEIAEKLAAQISIRAMQNGKDDIKVSF